MLPIISYQHLNALWIYVVYKVIQFQLIFENHLIFSRFYAVDIFH